MKASRYNFVVPNADSWLLFNARTGKILVLSGPGVELVLQNLMGLETPSEVEVDSHSYDLLVRNQFIVDDNFDELEAVREVYWSARREAPVVLTITTTLDCNLGCFYCYEERSPDMLDTEDIPAILDRTRRLLSRSKKSGLHVDWYGGEPTLNLPFLEEASRQLQQLCRDQSIRYSSSVISNGTSWPDDVSDFVRRHRIRQVQITFDGMAATHDRRRHFRHPSDSGRSSFAEAAALVSRLVCECRVDIRYNIDDRNKSEFITFARFALESGWFASKFRATLQPARVAAYSDKSRFVERIAISPDEFEALKRQAIGFLPNSTIEEPETMGGIAAPKTSVCAALSENAIVLGADHRTYRCGLQVSESHRAIGTLEENPFRILTNEAMHSDEQWWRDFDPTRLESCAACSFLPICLGGCPKKQLEKDKGALDAQSLYWRDNLSRLICKTANIAEVPFKFTEREQFRSTI